MEHFKVSFEPDGKTVIIHGGATILEAAGKVGIILNTVCGGKGRCGKCAVNIKGVEDEVYACIYEIDKDIEVTIPDTSRFYRQQILEHGIDRQIEVSPCIRKHLVNISSADSNHIRNALGEICIDHKCEINGNVSDKIKAIIGDGIETSVTFVSHLSNGDDQRLYKVISVEKGDTTADIYGAAIDIGTTTVVAKVIDMTSGAVVDTAAVENPQSQFGADVIARITYGSNEKGLKEMHSVIIDAIRKLIGHLCSDNNISKNFIYEACVVGNTTMNHIFLGHPVAQLGRKPFDAHSTESHNIPANEIDIGINPDGNIHTVANIAGFLGADTTGVALAVGMDNVIKETLVIDIGTNGELIVGTKDKMFAASCAAGPAFEGAMISQGGRAVKGAIQSVVINEDDIDIDVIGGQTAMSICGSGLIDVMATLVELGIVDSTGRFVDKEQLKDKLLEKITNRITEIDGQQAFMLADNSGSDVESVYFTQKDVRETQLAKAAMQAGIEILQKAAGIKDSEIEQVLLAGAFGNYIRRESAKRIGLLPDVEMNKVHFVGNAACTGAQMALLSCNSRATASQIAENIEHIELADSPDFNMIYAESMMF